MKTVTIVGVGLIGGSFALALRKYGYTGEILGVSSPATLARALELGVVDRPASLREAAQQSDLIYLAQPIARIVETLRVLGDWVGPGTLVTDAGSTKVTITRTALESIHAGQFLGGHPLAGKERRGVDAADADLFQGRPYVLTPVDESALETAAARDFLSWLAKIGAVPSHMDAEKHDRTVAYTSHLPQLASTALAALLAGQGPAVETIFGPALIDSTRLALSPFDIWEDILSTNKCQIQNALGAYIALLEQFREQLTSVEMGRFFKEGAEFSTLLRRDRA